MPTPTPSQSPPSDSWSPYWLAWANPPAGATRNATRSGTPTGKTLRTSTSTKGRPFPLYQRARSVPAGANTAKSPQTLGLPGGRTRLPHHRTLSRIGDRRNPSGDKLLGPRLGCSSTDPGCHRPSSAQRRAAFRPVLPVRARGDRPTSLSGNPRRVVRCSWPYRRTVRSDPPDGPLPSPRERRDPRRASAARQELLIVSRPSAPRTAGRRRDPTPAARGGDHA
jgi:hypothetical protein